MASERDNLMAGDGSTWVCLACGKTAKHRYGDWPGDHPQWDESCAMNSQQFPIERLVFRGGYVAEILPSQPNEPADG